MASSAWKVVSTIEADVRFGSKADMCSATRNVRFVPIADIQQYLELASYLRTPKKPIGNISRYFDPRDLRCRPDVAANCKPRTIIESASVQPLLTLPSLLSAFFSWAMGEGLADANPVIGTNKAAGEIKARDRVLTDTELATIWRGLPDNDYGRIVRLLALTGCRRDEIGSLRWSEIKRDARLIALPGERTKNSRTHDVPLSKVALEVIDSIPRRVNREFVFGEGKGGFSGWSKAKAALDVKLGLEPWRLHDLRRTASTRMADAGVQPHIIEAVINHVSGHKAGVAGVYNRSTYENEKRAALDALSNYVLVAVVKADGSNVQRIRRA